MIYLFSLSIYLCSNLQYIYSFSFVTADNYHNHGVHVRRTRRAASLRDPRAVQLYSCSLCTAVRSIQEGTAVCIRTTHHIMIAMIQLCMTDKGQTNNKAQEAALQRRVSQNTKRHPTKKRPLQSNRSYYSTACCKVSRDLEYRFDVVQLQ